MLDYVLNLFMRMLSYLRCNLLLLLCYAYMPSLHLFLLLLLTEDVNDFKPKIHYSVQVEILLKSPVVIKKPNILVCLLKS